MHLYYIAPFDLRVITVNLAKALQIIGLALVLPALVALACGEHQFIYIFAGIAGSSMLTGRLVSKALPGTPELELREALVVTSLAYLVFAALGSLAFLPVASWTDSFFEAMSGITTTGLSVMQVDTLPMSLLFFRAYSQWLGGLGIVVLSLAFLIQAGKSAHQLYLSSFSKATISGSVLATVRMVAGVYLLLTLAGLLAFIIAGMEPFDAMLHIMSTISTGGFSNHQQSIGYYSTNPAVEVAVIVFMML